MVALDILRLAKRLLASGVKCICVGQVCRSLQWRTFNFSMNEGFRDTVEGGIAEVQV